MTPIPGFDLLSQRRDGGGWRLEVAVDVDSPWFDGHFPGHPVLPAVAQLALVERSLDRLAGGGRIAALDRLRLPSQVAPGERLRLDLDRPAADGRFAFTLATAGAAGGEVASGAGSWAGGRDTEGDGADAAAGERAAARDEEGEEEATATATAPSPAGSALPHRGPALLAREVIGRAGELLCRGEIPPGSPLATVTAGGAFGFAPGFAAVELAAQAAALLTAVGDDAGGADRGGGGAPPIGYLVRVRGARFHRPRLPLATPLFARIEPAGAAGPLRLHRFTVALAADPAAPQAAEGVLGTYQLD